VLGPPALRFLPLIRIGQLLAQRLDGAFKGTDSPPVILPDIIPDVRRGRAGYLADDLPDDTPDIGLCPRRMSTLISGVRYAALSAGFAGLCQGDKDADNAVISGLARPMPAPG